jgi:hypothetical protein
MKWLPIADAPHDGTVVLTFDPTTADNNDDRFRLDWWGYIGRDKDDWPIYGFSGHPTHFCTLQAPEGSGNTPQLHRTSTKRTPKTP